MDVPVRELKNRLSEYLRRVRAGAEIHVTLRGKRIARLSPEPATSPDSEAETIGRLDAMPWVKSPIRSGGPRGAEQPLPAGKPRSEELIRWLRD